MPRPRQRLLRIQDSTDVGGGSCEQREIARPGITHREEQESSSRGEREASQEKKHGLAVEASRRLGWRRNQERASRRGQVYALELNAEHTNHYNVWIHQRGSECSGHGTCTFKWLSMASTTHAAIITAGNNGCSSGFEYQTRIKEALVGAASSFITTSARLWSDSHDCRYLWGLQRPSIRQRNCMFSNDANVWV